MRIIVFLLNCIIIIIFCRSVCSAQRSAAREFRVRAMVEYDKSYFYMHTRERSDGYDIGLVIHVRPRSRCTCHRA